jgi:hypothetical protein
LAGGVVPDVEAPEGSGFATGALGRVACLGRVPEVDGVGDERELEPELGGATGGGAGAGGAAGGAVLEGVLVGPSGCSLGAVVQLYWNSGTVSSSPVRNL